MQIFPKKGLICKIASSRKLFTPTCQYFYTDISAKFLHGYICNIFTRIYFYTDISVIFVTICNSASSRLRFTDLSQLMLMDNFPFIFSHFFANMLAQLVSESYVTAMLCVAKWHATDLLTAHCTPGK